MTPKTILTDTIEKFFIRFGIKYKRQSGEDLLLIRYFNFRLKYIPLVTRQIRVSNELSGKLSSHPNKNSVFDIFDKTIRGQDINPHQSKDSFNADFHDLLFNDWGIHHLHLDSSKKKTSDYFTKRTDLLIFVRFTNQIAYFIDIKSHNDNNVWSDTDLIRIIQNNWPDSIVDKEVKDIIWHPNLNNEEIGRLRKAGTLFGINVDGKAYLLLGHGQTTSGDNMMAVRIANEVSRWIWENKHLKETNLPEFEIQLKRLLKI